MQIFLLALVLALFLHDGLTGGRGLPELAPVALWTLAVAPKVLLAGSYWLLCVTVRGQLSRGRGRSAIGWLDRLTAVYRAGLLALFALDLWAGLLLAVRQAMGDPLLLDELLVLAPALAGLVFAWWAYYPIDRRLREAMLIREADEGRPIYPIWSRGQFVLAQARHQMALILVPLLLILAWIETVVLLGRNWPALITRGTEPALVFAGTGLIFAMAPLILRYIWDTVPLPAGEIRQRLAWMCEVHGVGVRELLLWRTYGGMINAAVMGLVGPLRYILLSDALLQSVPQRQVEAVMAHELGHVRHHHMFWLLAAAGGSLGLLQAIAWWVLTAGANGAERGAELVAAGPAMAGWSREGLLVLVMGGAILWFALFGWVSRRFERQADSFAVQHLATQRAEPARDRFGRVVVDAASAQTMIGALQQVAELNHIPPHQRNWRHGAIAWRQQHLRSLVGLPVDALPIDRQMRWIKLASAGAVGAAILLYALG